MWEEYARLSKEKDVEAIYEHYLPSFAGDRLPSSPIGDIVSIADKMDTIVGGFEWSHPYWNSRSFWVERQALGIIRIILEKNYSISLRDLMKRVEGS